MTTKFMDGSEGYAGLKEVPADGWCPVCCALWSEACQTPAGNARPDHNRRHPYDPALKDEMRHDMGSRL